MYLKDIDKFDHIIWPLTSSIKVNNIDEGKLYKFEISTYSRVFSEHYNLWLLLKHSISYCTTTENISELGLDPTIELICHNLQEEVSSFQDFRPDYFEHYIIDPKQNR